MRIYVDLVTLLPTAEIWERGQIVAPTAKRGDGDPLEVQFHRSGTPERLPAGTIVTFIIKAQGKFDQSPALVELEIGDAGRPASDAGFYTGEPDYNTEPLDTALFSGDANTSNDLRFVLGDGEISWLLPTVGAKPKSSQTFTVTIANDVKKGNEGPPSSGAPTYLTAAQSDARYARPGLDSIALPAGRTSLTGGGSTALDGLTTTTLPVGYTIGLFDAGIFRVYRLTASTAAESAPGTIRPDDYNASTNAKVWIAGF